MAKSSNKEVGAKPRRRRGVAAVTEAAILEAATPVFARYGYEAVSMRTIAELAGITPPSIYLYFKDKRSLYLAVCLHSFARQTGFIQSAVEGAITPAAKLRAFISATAHGLIQYPDTARLFQRELVETESEVLVAAERAAFQAAFDLLISLLSEVTGSPYSPQKAMSFFALILGLIQFSQLLELVDDQSVGFNHDAEALTQHVIETLIPQLMRSDPTT